MRKKKRFVKPDILQEPILLSARAILQGSVSDNTTIVSMGQQVVTYEFDDSDEFNHKWE
ncbi:MAG: hypothetical protein IKO29_04750 [Bacteroidales bacterium]|nr:hypothetical protein [Bacteroidales bacterium]